MWNWIHTKYFLMANPGREGNAISGETVKTQLHLYCSFIFIQVYRKYERIWVFPFCWWINGYLLINILFFFNEKMPAFKELRECYRVFWPRIFKRLWEAAHIQAEQPTWWGHPKCITPETSEKTKKGEH